MPSHRQPLQRALCILALVMIAGCATAPSGQQSPPSPQAGTATPPPAAGTATPPSAADTAGDSAHFEFAGTDWQLVEILSMDGSRFTPAKRSDYTLSFAADGKLLLRADCKRGGSTWSSQGPNQLQFGPIASTRMQCSPESLSERYLAQFEWVRSYVTRDGHLFLATMADGAIIEFEPLP